MKMLVKYLFVLFPLVYYCAAQVMQFGSCPDVVTMTYFDVERFLGVWYEIERYPIWYEELGQCAYKNIQACGRKIEIEHVYIKDNIQYILHVNSSYIPGDEAVFNIEATNIDPIGIPMFVITTDYMNYAVVYGCKNNDILGIRYMTAWILSREKHLSDEILVIARDDLTKVPYASVFYLQKVIHRDEKCNFYWSAHVHGISTNETEYDDE